MDSRFRGNDDEVGRRSLRESPRLRLFAVIGHRESSRLRLMQSLGTASGRVFACLRSLEPGVVGVFLGCSRCSTGP